MSTPGRSSNLGWLVVLSVVAAAGCARAVQTEGTVATPPVLTPPQGEQVVEEGPFAARPVAGAPRILVQNDYNVTQHVFIDGVQIGTVPTGGVQAFDIAPGEHTIVCSDSDDLNDNPVAATRVFVEGYEVLYQVYSGSAPPRRW